MRNIKLEGRLKEYRAIMIDGVKWGHVVIERHGVRGVSYGIHAWLKHLASVRGIGTRQARRIGRQPQPVTDAQIIEQINKLIDEGSLRDPAVVKAEMDAIAQERTDRLERMKAATKAQWDTRITEAVKAISFATSPEERRKAISEAMEWARSH